MDFRVLPSGDYTLTNLTAPGCLIGQAAPLAPISLTVRGGRLAAPEPSLAQVDMAGAMVFPAFTDMHTHLDKGHIWPRAANPDGAIQVSTVGYLTTNNTRSVPLTRENLRRHIQQRSTSP